MNDFIKITEILMYLHQKGFHFNCLHKNSFVKDKNGNVKIIDLGLHYKFFHIDPLSAYDC